MTILMTTEQYRRIRHLLTMRQIKRIRYLEWYQNKDMGIA